MYKLKRKECPHNLRIVFLLVAVGIASQLACTKLHRTAQPTATPSPSAEDVVGQIFSRYAEAIGGEEAIDKITSFKAKGTFRTSLTSETGQFEAWGKEPNKTLSVIKFPRIGVLKKGFDGDERWVQTPVGTFTDESPNEMAQVERDADVYRVGRIKSFYQTMKLDSKARMSGRDVYVVEGKPAKGPAEKLFFDVDSGLLLRWDMARRTARRGNVFVKVHLDDYRDVDGVKEPFKVRFAFESFDLTFTVDEVKHNVGVDDSIFKKPGGNR
jgi:hypothetical protein